MIVVDSSLLVSALTSDEVDGHSARALLSEDPAWHAPEHLRVEVTNAVRGRLIGRKITLDRAEKALSIFAQMEIVSAPWGVIADRVWELRDNMNPYDAAYVALAERLECALATRDRKLADCPTRRCEIRVIE